MRLTRRWNSDSSGSSEPDFKCSDGANEVLVVLAHLVALDAVGRSCEDHERRAGSHDLLARLGPLRFLDLRLLREVDFLARNFLAQNGAVDHRHDMASELADKSELFGIRVRKLHKQACRIVGGKRLLYCVIGGGCITDALDLAEAVRRRWSARTGRCQRSPKPRAAE